jgi:hypothetical protein
MAAHKTFAPEIFTITLGEGQKLVLTELNLLEIQQWRKTSSELTPTTQWADYVKSCCDLIYASAHRAMPDLTERALQEMLTMKSWAIALDELLILSGLRAIKEGEASPMAESTGASSTSSSSTPPAGHSIQ